jgi:hypothetical protein
MNKYHTIDAFIQVLDQNNQFFFMGSSSRNNEHQLLLIVYITSPETHNSSPFMNYTTMDEFI